MFFDSPQLAAGVPDADSVVHYFDVSPLLVIEEVLASFIFDDFLDKQGVVDFLELIQIEEIARVVVFLAQRAAEKFVRIVQNPAELAIHKLFLKFSNAKPIYYVLI